MLEIKDIILEHIRNRQESTYLDFKQEWHNDFGHLAKDIIAMANTVSSRDSYIVIGVTDSFEIVGIESVKWDKANISSNLRDLYFASGAIPKIDLIEETIEEKKIKIIKIIASNAVPYYIKQKPNKTSANLQPNVIYTRANDSNKEATFEECELLWKKRFGLLLSEKEKSLSQLELLENWEFSETEIYSKSYNDLKIKTEEISIFPFYRKSENGKKELIPYLELQRDTYLKKEVWDFCNGGFPIDINQYRIIKARLIKGNTAIFSVDLIEILLKHYPLSGGLITYYIPNDFSIIKKGKESLIKSDEYKFCKILYSHANESTGVNDEYLEFMDWDFIQKVNK